MAKVQDLYNDSMFFKHFREQYDVYGKIFFPLTAYMKNDPEFGDFGKLFMMSS
jgi:phosphoenolpyruvate carboxylase